MQVNRFLDLINILTEGGKRKDIDIRFTDGKRLLEPSLFCIQPSDVSDKLMISLKDSKDKLKDAVLVPSK